MTQKGAEREAGGSMGRAGGRTISQGDLAEGPDPNPSWRWESPCSPTGNTGRGLPVRAGWDPDVERGWRTEVVVAELVGDLSATIPAAGTWWRCGVGSALCWVPQLRTPCQDPGENWRGTDGPNPTGGVCASREIS